MSRWALTLLALAPLAACSSPEPSSDHGQSNAATPKHATVFVGMMDTDKQAVDAAVEKMFARYRRSPDIDGDDGGLIDRSSYTKSFETLLKHWVAAQPAGEIDSILSDADWVCQCQDWLGTGFKFVEKTIQPLPDNQIEAKLRFDLGDGDVRQARILFIREDKIWKVANLFSPMMPNGAVAEMTANLARWQKK